MYFPNIKRKIFNDLKEILNQRRHSVKTFQLYQQKCKENMYLMNKLIQ